MYRLTLISPFTVSVLIPILGSDYVLSTLCPGPPVGQTWNVPRTRTRLRLRPPTVEVPLGTWGKKSKSRQGKYNDRNFPDPPDGPSYRVEDPNRPERTRNSRPVKNDGFFDLDFQTT